MKFGERLQQLRKKKGITQMQLAERLDVSFQTVSSWECGEYFPNMGKLPRLAQELGVSADYLLGDETPAGHSLLKRDRLFSEEHMYTHVKTAASVHKLTNTMKALPFMKKAHAGQIRKSTDGAKVPYISHPLNMACHALALGIKEDDIIAAILLHDVMEDCGTALEELPVSNHVKNIIVTVTKTKAAKEDPGESRIQNEKLDKYYGGIMQSREAMVVKILDRLNNVCSMPTGFTKDRMVDYVQETEIYILPMLEKLTREYPEFYDAAYLIRYHLLSLLEMVKWLLV